MTPEVDAGRFPSKGIVGDELRVEADVFADGHDRVAAVLAYQKVGARRWREVAMESGPNDRWSASFPLEELGRYRFTVLAWVDPLLTWIRDLEKWVAAGRGEEVVVELLAGVDLVEATAERARRGSKSEARFADKLLDWSRRLREGSEDPGLRKEPHRLAEKGGPLDGALAALANRFPDREFETRYPRELEVVVDRPLARFSAWYEFFPRSTGDDPTRHGTFGDAKRMLPYVREMGFDVVYLPPIHPVGDTNRKGRNNKRTAEPGEPGSPWAIGSDRGGHTAVHPELGSLDDFRSFRKAAEKEGLEVALDVAYQCSPDHPWVKEHPEWFRHLPDGSIRYAENPPKKYEDIYPVDFQTDDWPALWEELKGVFSFWASEGVRVFRVDNPHTKALAFWEWAIAQLKREYPDLIFLSEAFTRPKMMYRLAKLGFTQSYTYFAWRNTKWELTEYMEELAHGPACDYFRPNFWPNTPDILTEALQSGKRPTFVTRLVLAATMSSNYGIYGPAFELMEHLPREPGSEEYLDSEKYQIRHWDLARPDSLKDLIARVNRIRRGNPALQRNDTIRFHPVDNEAIVAYSKHDPDVGNRILTVVSLDPDHTQSGWVNLDLSALGMEIDERFTVEDCLAGGRFVWQGARNFVDLNPEICPAHVFRLGRELRPHPEIETP